MLNGFKVWDRGDNHWISPSEYSMALTSDGKFIYDMIDVDCKPLIIENLVICHNTNLCDRNGISIFVVDIVKWKRQSDGEWKIQNSDDIYGSVRYDRDRFVIHQMSYGFFETINGAKFPQTFYDPPKQLFHWDELEVVGNIFESKELLQQIEKWKGK